MRYDIKKYDNHIEVVSGDIVGHEKKKSPLIPAVALVILLLSALVAFFFLVKGLGVRDIVPPKPELYENIWIEGSDATSLRYFYKGEHCSLPFARNITRDHKSGEDAMYPEGIADIEVLEGEITGVAVKGDLVRAKLLQLKPGGIELEGLGYCELSEGFQVYSMLDGLAMGGTQEIPVGYDTAEYLVENGVVQAAVVVDTCKYDKIRVAIGNTGYTSLIHKQVILSSEVPLRMTYADSTRVFEPGEKIEITVDSGYLAAGRVSIEPEEEGLICVESIERGGAKPSYRGRLEISTYDAEGILLINELPLEEYLYSVVPSEMSVSYGSEALQVQAICARAYAYRKMLDGTYAKYGAHLDDSTMTQVYRAVAETPESVEAVDATRGMVPTYEGEVIEAYFFSTSCGTTTNNADVWGGEALPYLQDTLENAEGSAADFTSEADFRDLMEHPEEYELLEQEYPMFRWSIAYTDDEMQQAVKETIAGRYEANPELFTWEEKPASSEEADEIVPLPDLGRIESIEVSKRGKSGIVTELTLCGTAETMKVSGQTNVRALMTPIHVKLTNAEGMISEGWSSLPSPFYYIERDEEQGYIIHGGGFGHGVGMSQNGTKTLTESELSAEAVLKHYYTGIKLERLYN